MIFHTIIFLLLLQSDVVYCLPSLNSIPFIEIHRTSQGLEPYLFYLPYDKLNDWKSYAKLISEKENIDIHVLTEAIQSQLTKFGYSSSVVDGAEYPNGNNKNGEGGSLNFKSSDAIQILTNSASRIYRNQIANHNAPIDSYDAKITFSDSTIGGAFRTPSNPFIDINILIDEYLELSLLHDSNNKSNFINNIQIPWYAPATFTNEHDFSKNQTIIIYQTRFAFTGGTVALSDLHKQLKLLGFHTLLCDESNHGSNACVNPRPTDIVISGEWCHEVLADHGVREESFTGRGVQYHLGAHHAFDRCNGRVAATDSHFLLSQFASRSFTRYFLGCAMRDKIKERLSQLLIWNKHLNIEESETNGESNVELTKPMDKHGNAIPAPMWKERLVLVDPDFFNEYAPRHRIDLNLPIGWTYTIVQGFSLDEMLVLLERAAIVLDLGMPGPERLSTEASLFGAIPIISDRWNGASRVDFPGAVRVDALNGTAVTEAIFQVASQYEEYLHSNQMGTQWAYATSMWRRLHHTTHVYFGSSQIHFVISAHGLIEESIAIMQITTLLYYLPLASFDLYVQDKFWFLRHHYSWWEDLITAGLSRHDPFDPKDYVYFNGNQSSSFVRIQSHDKMRQALNIFDNDSSEVDDFPLKNHVNMKELLPEWSNLLVVLPIGMVSVDPFRVMRAAAMTKEGDKNKACKINEVLFLVGDDGVLDIDRLRLCAIVGISCNDDRKEDSNSCDTKEDVAIHNTDEYDDLWFDVCELIHNGRNTRQGSGLTETPVWLKALRHTKMGVHNYDEGTVANSKEWCSSSKR